MRCCRNEVRHFPAKDLSYPFYLYKNVSFDGEIDYEDSEMVSCEALKLNVRVRWNIIQGKQDLLQAVTYIVTGFFFLFPFF